MSAITPQAEPYTNNILSPVSPKPLHYPSPSNIPILEKQMDPGFHDSIAHEFTQAHNQSLAQEGQTSSALYPNPQSQEPGTLDMDMSRSMLPNGEASPADASSSMPSATQASNVFERSTGETPATSFVGNPTASNIPSNSSQTIDAPVASHDPQNGGQVGPGITTTQFPNADTVDFDALLANLSKSPANTFAAVSGSQPDPYANPPLAGQGGDVGPAAAHSNHSLPPRPPPQDKPSIHPNYSQSDDLRAYHPHSQFGPPSGSSNVMPGGNGNQAQAAPPFPQPNTAPPFPAQSPTTPTFSQQPTSGEPRFTNGDQWDAEVQRKYDNFLNEERAYDQDRNWAKFPDGSRLFVGNLPTELVTKRDLFLRFYKYGLIVQISIKKAFGFVQYLDQEACARAMSGEQGTVIQGRKINLEISRPQQDRNQHGGGRDGRRRSRSPPRNRGQQGQGAVDRYRERPVSPRSRDRHYRPGRSPSPRGYRGGRRDRSPPGRDRYDGRRRSRSPPGRYMGGGSPRRAEDDDGLPFPRRHPSQVPDVQIVVVENVERNFISLIESQFTQKGLRTEVLHLPPGIPHEAIVKRHALEGVTAVVTISRQAMGTYSVPIMLFDRSQGTGNVKFEVYDHVKPDDAPHLVIRHKQAQQHGVGPPMMVGQPQPWNPAPAPSPYGYPAPNARPYDAAPSQQQPPTVPALGNVDIHSLLTTINSNPELQRLVAQAQQNQPLGFPPQHASASAQADVSNLLRSVQQSQPGPHPGQPYGPPQQSIAGSSGQQNPLAALSALLSSVGGNATPATATAPPPPQQSQGAQPDMAELMAQLAQYNGRK